MRIRYCFTILHQWQPCQVGWGRMDSRGVRDCTGEPMEKNCHNLVDTTDVLICPTCGTALGLIEDNMEIKE